MPKSYPKRPRDTAELAKFVVEIATGERPDDRPVEQSERAVKGGVARAQKLSKTKRTAIARKAARKRWSKG